jgi:hypothetical protein
MIANKLSGWYYDLQLENRLTCATLHPSKILKNGKWEKFSESEDEEAKQEDKDNKEYSKKPICSAIITEDFNVSVANSWSAFGGDMIGQMWESVKPLAPYAKVFAGMIHDAVTEYDKASPEMKAKIKESTASTVLAETMRAIDQTVQNNEANITDYLNRSLVVQGTRFSYYSGSGTSFGNLVMKFTIFPKYKGSNFITVNEQISDILPYCIGQFVNGTDGLQVESNETRKLIDNMIGWQKPPGGFESYIRDVDVDQPGTLMLRFGAFYCITNLVVENANFNFSKQMVKKPDPTMEGKILSPLYCDVTIQLRPATKYSSESLERFISSRASTSVLDEVHKDLKKVLEPNLSVDTYVY